jgi:hypothetical protein
MGPYNYQDYRSYFPQPYQSSYQQFQQLNTPNIQTNGNSINNIQSQQMMTPPTIHAEIVQISGKDEAINFPVGTGQTQMMMTKDEASIFIKSVFANGQSTIIEYSKKLEEPGVSKVDYITRDEFEKRIAELEKNNSVLERKEDNHE